MKLVSAAAFLVVVAAGCGGGDSPQGSEARGVPRALAQAWAGRASAIATAASAGNSCRALHLATSLRDDVSAEQQKVPSRLRSPLLTGVNALADRITCTPVVQKPPKQAPKKPPKPKPGPKPPKPHGPGHDHGRGGDG